ncbi:MAG: hypothetical protein R2794_11765 [Chitinophagales bacterium]
MAKKTKRPKDSNTLAKLIVDIATGEIEDIKETTSTPLTEDGKNAAAVALGRLGGLKGGKARAAKLTPEQRAEIARKAAKKRWGKK